MTYSWVTFPKQWGVGWSEGSLILVFFYGCPAGTILKGLDSAVGRRYGSFKSVRGTGASPNSGGGVGPIQLIWGILFMVEIQQGWVSHRFCSEGWNKKYLLHPSHPQVAVTDTLWVYLGRASPFTRHLLWTYTLFSARSQASAASFCWRGSVLF